MNDEWVNSELGLLAHAIQMPGKCRRTDDDDRFSGI